MTDDQITLLRQLTEPREGRKRHMYLDTIGLVTVGIGHMIPSADAAVRLPFLPSGFAREDWLRVHRAAPEEPAARLKFCKDHNADFYEPLSHSRLTDQAIDELFARTARGFVADLEHAYPEFSRWPWPAQQATFDMIYSLGPARLAEYRRMNAALLRLDFRAAASECFRHGWNDTPEKPNARNRYTRDLYLQAAG